MWFAISVSRPSRSESADFLCLFGSCKAFSTVINGTSSSAYNAGRYEFLETARFTSGQSGRLINADRPCSKLAQPLVHRLAMMEDRGSHEIAMLRRQFRNKAS
jgi:hypothetical protein